MPKRGNCSLTSSTTSSPSGRRATTRSSDATYSEASTFCGSSSTTTTAIGRTVHSSSRLPNPGTRRRPGQARRPPRSADTTDSAASPTSTQSPPKTMPDRINAPHRFSGGPRSRRAPRRYLGRTPGSPRSCVDGLRRATRAAQLLRLLVGEEPHLVKLQHIIRRVPQCDRHHGDRDRVVCAGCEDRPQRLGGDHDLRVRRQLVRRAQIKRPARAARNVAAVPVNAGSA
jgi:hypothetical protein